MIISALFKSGIECGKHFSESVNIAENYGYVKDTCKNAEKVSRQIFTIPIHNNFSGEKINYIAQKLKDII